MNELLILDVAHGNSALLKSNEFAAVFDAAPKDVLLQTIYQSGIDTIDYLLLSHLDQDHVAGVINILASNIVNVRRLYVNPDSTKAGKRNVRLRLAIDDAIKKKRLEVYPIFKELGNIQVGEVIVEIVSPRFVDYLSGPGGEDVNGVKIDSNSSSAIVMLAHKDHPVALLAADMDQRSLDRIIDDDKQNISVDVLIFPHHGGICADNNEDFTKKLIYHTHPQVTVFSMGRSIHDNPRKEVVNAIRAISPKTHIMCTQLSKNCLLAFPGDLSNWQEHLNNIPGAGRKEVFSCAGSLKINIDGDKTTFDRKGDHTSFIISHVPGAICMK